MKAVKRYNSNFKNKELKIKEITTTSIILLTGVNTGFDYTSRDISRLVPPFWKNF